MANARDIKRKIQSVQSTQKITKAMKMVSASKMRKAVEVMTSARPYSEKMKEIIHDLSLRMNGTEHNFFKNRELVKNIGLLIVASDRGLCGAFNSNILKVIIQFCKNHKDQNIKLYIVGKRAFDFLKKSKLDILSKWVDLGAKYDFHKASEVGSLLVKAYEEETVDELYVVYNQFKSTSCQETKVEKILPLSIENKGEYIYPDFQYEPDISSLLDKLLPEYINTTVYQSMLESAAGEHGARMVAMDNATRSAGEMIKKLVLNYNKARQGAITTELLDIVNGAEALK